MRAYSRPRRPRCPTRPRFGTPRWIGRPCRSTRPKDPGSTPGTTATARRAIVAGARPGHRRARRHPADLPAAAARGRRISPASSTRRSRSRASARAGALEAARHPTSFVSGQPATPGQPGDLRGPQRGAWVVRDHRRPTSRSPARPPRARRRWARRSRSRSSVTSAPDAASSLAFIGGQAFDMTSTATAQIAVQPVIAARLAHAHRPSRRRAERRRRSRPPRRSRPELAASPTATPEPTPLCFAAAVGLLDQPDERARRRRRRSSSPTSRRPRPSAR